MRRSELGGAGLGRVRQIQAMVRFVDRFGLESPDFAGEAASDRRPMREILTVGQLNRAVAEVLQAGFPQL